MPPFQSLGIGVAISPVFDTNGAGGAGPPGANGILQEGSIIDFIMMEGAIDFILQES